MLSTGTSEAHLVKEMRKAHNLTFTEVAQAICKITGTVMIVSKRPKRDKLINEEDIGLLKEILSKKQDCHDIYTHKCL